MKKLESTLTNMVLVLTAVALISAGLLGVMQQLTKEPIALIEKQTLENGIKKVMLPDGNGTLSVSNEEKVTTDNGEFTVYTAVADDNEIGKAIKTTVTGFSPGLTVLVGFDNDGNIKGYEILKHSETPGLGAKVDNWFQKGQKGDIIGKNPGDAKFKVRKDDGEVDAITASTITSRAFLKAIKAEYDVFMQTKGKKTAKMDGMTGATVKSESK